MKTILNIFSKLLILIVLFNAIQSFSQSFNTWIGTGGYYSNMKFQKTGYSSWEIEGKSVILTEVSREGNPQVIYLQTYNSSGIIKFKLTENAIYFSKASSSDPSWEFKGTGYWKTILPTFISADKSGFIRAGTSVSLTPGGTYALSLQDYWIWSLSPCFETPCNNLISSTSELIVAPDYTTTYYLTTSQGVKEHNYLSYTINVDTASYLPNQINGPTSEQCANSNVHLTFSGGTLGKNAYWAWSNNTSFQNILKTQSNFLDVSPSVTTTYYLVIMKNNKVISQFRSFTVTVKPMAPTPNIINSVDELCPGNDLVLNIVGPALDANSEWVITLKNKNGQLTSQRSREKKIIFANIALASFLQKSEEITVELFSQNSCYRSPTITKRIRVKDYGYEIRDIDIKVTKIKHRFNLTPVINSDDALEYEKQGIVFRYEWYNGKNMKLISSNKNLSNYKLKNGDLIKLTVKSSCSNLNSQYTYTVPKKEKASKSAKTSSHKEKTSSSKSNSNHAQRDHAKITRPRLALDLSTGINNKVGVAGAELDFFLRNQIAIGAGYGYATWGNKIYAGFKLFTTPRREMVAFDLGFTYNLGKKNISEDLATTHGSSDPVTGNYLPQFNAYGAILLLPNAQRKVYYSLGYSYAFADKKYEQLSGFPILDATKESMKLMSPGGIVVSIGFYF